MALDLLLQLPILGRLVQPRRQSCTLAAKAYPKVLKHLQLGMFQIRAVSRSTGTGSFGKKMGKLVGKPVQTSDILQKRSPAILSHLMHMDESSPCDEKPCRTPPRDGVCLQ